MVSDVGWIPLGAMPKTSMKQDRCTDAKGGDRVWSAGKQSLLGNAHGDDATIATGMKPLEGGGPENKNKSRTADATWQHTWRNFRCLGKVEAGQRARVWYR